MQEMPLWEEINTFGDIFYFICSSCDKILFAIIEYTYISIGWDIFILEILVPSSSQYT